MLERLESIEKRYADLNDLMSRREVAGDFERLQHLLKERAAIEHLVAKYREYKNTLKDLHDTQGLVVQGLDEEMAEKIARTILSKCKACSLPPSLVVHLIFRESSFNQMAVSSAGAIGLMGIMQKYHPEKCESFSRNQLFSIETNLDIGCRILREFIDGSGSLEEALQKYVGKSHRTYAGDIFRLMAEYEFEMREENGSSSQI